jgi:hypothetical protein
MQSEFPSPSFIWGDLAERFETELTRQKSEIWRLSGLSEEYGGSAEGDFYREREQKAFIELRYGSFQLQQLHRHPRSQRRNDDG